ncbi:hypothetical protein PC116_g15715 [Phytophthora cactorum]|nr:hypothetical protein PC114_g6088 [Phytophthora cactorum]KAG3030450.1 hypothetical protein PC120_g3760 [Phytophthora cactorum]KAG4236183.1 hypothetical protein PC116_g15715 [Phytophthora cactorum]
MAFFTASTARVPRAARSARKRPTVTFYSGVNFLDPGVRGMA